VNKLVKMSLVGKLLMNFATFYKPTLVCNKSLWYEQTLLFKTNVTWINLNCSDADVYKIMLKVKVFCHRWSPLMTATDDLDDASQRSRIAQRLGLVSGGLRSRFGLVLAVKANVSVARADVSVLWVNVSSPSLLTIVTHPC